MTDRPAQELCPKRATPMEERVLESFLKLMLVLVLAGCITGHYSEGSAIAWEAVDSLRPGVTTKSEVLERFGAPHNFSSPIALAEFFESQGLEAEAYSRYPFTDVFAYQLNRGKLRGFTVIF